MQLTVTPVYLDTLKDRLRSIQEAHRALEVERQSLLRLLRLHGIEVDEDRPVTDRPKRSRNGRGVSQQILDYIRAHDGCQTLDVVNALDGKISTSSKDPRRYLRSVVDTHVKRGKVRRDDDGALHAIKQLGGLKEGG